MTQLELFPTQAPEADTIQLGALGHDVHKALMEVMDTHPDETPDMQEIVRIIALRLWREGWRLV